MDLSRLGAAPCGGLNVFNKRPLDLAYLSRRPSRNRLLEREALAGFRQKAAVCLTRLRAANSAEAWFDAARRLDDSARSIGAWELSQTAGAAGRLRGAPRNGASAALVRTLEAQVSDANAFIAEILKGA
jgi:hypothetical protein